MKKKKLIIALPILLAFSLSGCSSLSGYSAPNEKTSQAEVAAEAHAAEAKAHAAEAEARAAEIEADKKARDAEIVAHNAEAAARNAEAKAKIDAYNAEVKAKIDAYNAELAEYNAQVEAARQAYNAEVDAYNAKNDARNAEIKARTGHDPKFLTCAIALSAGYGNYSKGSVEYEWYLDENGDGKVCEK